MKKRASVYLRAAQRIALTLGDFYAFPWSAEESLVGCCCGALVVAKATIGERLRADNATLAAIVRAADAMHLKPTMDNINAWVEARAKWEGNK